jgi:Skp family chaperone for outer membrane proteins
MELQDLRVAKDRLAEELQESGTDLGAARDKEMSSAKEVQVLKHQLEELIKSKANAVSDDREKRKAEMLAEMMSKIETVSVRSSSLLTNTKG